MLNTLDKPNQTSDVVHVVIQAIIDVDLLGFVYHWGLEVNSITVIGEPYICRTCL